jgi:hypothetical protein
MAVTMRQVTGNIDDVVKGMDKAMESMNLECVRPLPPPSFYLFLPCTYIQISLVMDGGVDTTGPSGHADASDGGKDQR